MAKIPVAVAEREVRIVIVVAVMEFGVYLLRSFFFYFHDNKAVTNGFPLTSQPFNTKHLVH
ncbi:hypothetical protein DIJ64_13080 [Mycobacterium leprae]|uniref:U1740z n=1 Tax=Mycobacterium leprae TaxID=1769 RepID=Q50084_MYCLR|nr:hypothetical protein [Mycobacterium leprae]AAA63002.1 u1740z [Mycobacterium leprae]AWV48658.1 hypothetical protein DIJ64_13080 [Mycobacterium leprae]OAR19627.1 hypothetical protein A8144_13830 [Mycobacterium leprae 3125609]OAX70120.1 hypothetical protein A3216_13915 [Mycobacterium leprae 7935681]